MSVGSPDYLLLRVSQLYFEQGLTQQEIGRRLHITRWQVGRLLASAKERGIVQIRIVHPSARDHEMERQLLATGYLKDAVVVPGDPDIAVGRLEVANAAAEYLADYRPSPKIVSMTWGYTMTDMVDQIQPGWAKNVTVVQANGGIAHPGTSRDAGSVVAKLARQGQGKASYLLAPAITTSAKLAEAFRKEPVVSEVLDAARKADVIVFSLGALSPRSILVESGCVTEPEIKDLADAGAVGDILARYLDASGRPVSQDFQSRTIGLDLSDIKNCPVSIAVSNGKEKHQITLATVLSRICNTLVTDMGTARYLLENLPGVGQPTNHSQILECGRKR